MFKIKIAEKMKYVLFVCVLHGLCVRLPTKLTVAISNLGDTLIHSSSSIAIVLPTFFASVVENARSDSAVRKTEHFIFPAKDVLIRC
jgi:hypothetical protein